MYPAAIGPEFSALHPRLATYFDAIPLGSVGTGVGVFDVVGTPRRWLWPALWLLGRAGVLFPAWQRNVPFVVENRSRVDESGQPVVSALRRFRFPSGDRVMIDRMRIRNGRLVDRIGTSGLIEAEFASTVENGGLVLRSRRVAIRLGGVRIPIPARVSPVVTLSERFDDHNDCQRVLVTIDAPMLGRLYEYGGSFRYVVEPIDESSITEGERP